MKSLQDKVEQKKVTADLVGHCFVLIENIAPRLSPTYRYSGIDWKLISSEALNARTTVEVTDIAVDSFIVKANA